MSVGAVSNGRRKGEQMKLYFYILESPYNEEPFIRFEECSVVEKPKTYKPIERFHSGIYGAYFLKENIGRLTGTYKKSVALVVNDPERALRTIEDMAKDNIAGYEKKILEEKKILKAVEDYRKNG